MKTKTILIAVTAIAILLLMTKKAIAKPTKTGIIRGCDPFGCGEMGASRGGRTHQGEDYKVSPGENVFSPISGKVTRFPFPYGDDLKWTGIEIKNDDYSMKIFYMKPSVKIGDAVSAGQVIGTAQNIASKYGTSMTNHIHVEIRDTTGKLLELSKLN